MNGFDRFCAVLAGILGAVLLLLGAIGIFFGSAAHFRLPPILGGLPALVGWGIIRTVMLAWNVPSQSADSSGSSSANSPLEPPPPFTDWSDND